MSATPETQKVIEMTEKPTKDEGDEEVTNPGCGILGRYPVLAVLTFAATGIATGVGLSFWEPDDPDTKSTLLKWLGLIGDCKYQPTFHCSLLLFSIFNTHSHPAILCPSI